MKKKLRDALRFIFKYRVVVIAVYSLIVTLVCICLVTNRAGDVKAEGRNETTTENTTYSEWEYFEISAYCSCKKCCGKWANNRPTDEYGDEIVIGAANVPIEEGETIAADWDILPKGTVVEIEGYGVYTVEDRGEDIKGYKIDIYFDSHEIANAFGRKCVAVRVLEWG